MSRHLANLMILFLVSPMSMAQAGRGFFMSDENAATGRYERGYYLVGEPDIPLADPTKPLVDDLIRYFTGLRLVSSRYHRGEGAHIMYMDISDAGYDQLVPMIDALLQQVFAVGVDKENAACARYFLARETGFADNSLEAIAREYNDGKRQAGNAEYRLYDDFRGQVQAALGDQVLDQVDRFVTRFALTVHPSISNGIEQGMRRGEPLESLLQARCELF